MRDYVKKYERYLLWQPLPVRAAPVFKAPGIVAHGGVRVVHWGVLSRAVKARAGLVAALRLLAPAPRTLHFVGIFDRNEAVPALEGVAEPRV